MTPPELTLTMLGTTSSGKSTFLLGMYDVLSAGLHGYFTYTEDPDQGVDLQDDWDRLLEEGTLPTPTQAGGTYYRFVFNHGTTPLVTVDWMDYRGGALDDRADSGPDVLELRDRLNRSDSIYLVLDGGTLATWLDDPRQRSRVQRKLKVQAMSASVLAAVRHRAEHDLPTPSIVVVITKSDLLRAADRTVGQALAVIVANLENLLPVACAQGVTALVCPVKVGDFGSGGTRTVAVEDIDPVGLHRPMVFSLMQHLVDGLGAREAQLVAHKSGRSAVEQQLVELNQGFRAVFRGRRTSELRGVAASYEESIAEGEQLVSSDRNLIAALAKEIDGHPIIANGSLVQ